MPVRAQVSQLIEGLARLLFPPVGGLAESTLRNHNGHDPHSDLVTEFLSLT